MDKNQLKHIIKEEYHNVKSFMEDKYGFTPELGKVISNPYAKSFVNEVQEPEVISQLRDIVNKKQNKKIKDPKSGKMMRVDMMSASAVIAVYDALRKPNVKANFASQPLPKMVNVAFKVAKVRKENVAKNHDGKAAPYGSGYKKVNEEKVYIDFLNKKKGFKQDRIHFDNYKKAVKWARKNLEKFHPDMIHYESVNEILVIVDKFDKNKQEYGKIYYQDGGNRPGDGDIKKANKELAKLSKKHKGLTLVSVGRNSKMYDVNESVNEEFKSKDSTFEKVYGIFDKRDYFNNKGFAKTQIGNFERALQKKDKGAQKILDKFKGDVNKAKDYIFQVLTDRRKEESFNDYKAFKAAVDSIQKGKPIPGAVDLVKRKIHNNSQKYTMALYSTLRNQKFNKWKDIHTDVDSLIGESLNEAFLVAYGKREGNKSIKPAFAAYADKKMAQKFMADMKKDGYKVMMTQKKIKGIDEGEKRYNVMHGVGKSKYVVNYHDGKKKHNDGSDFFDMSIFKNKKDLAKKVNDLHKSGYKYGFAKSVKEGVFSNLDLIRQNSKDARDFIKNVFKDDDFKDMKNDREFLKYLKSIYEGFASDAQRRAAFASGYKAKGKKGKKKESIEEYDVENYQDVKEFVEFMKEYKSDVNEAEYQGRDVKLNKIMQGDVKKFKVYVKNPKGNVVKVNFGHKGKGGEKTMRIKKSDPERRKSFRARHNCDNPGPRHKARYWACRTW